MHFQQTQLRFASVVLDLDGVLGPLRPTGGAMHKASRGPFKGTMLAQKALQGSETEARELLGGTEEKSVSRRGDFLQKKETEKS